jgi:hypothetical protein
MKVSGPAVTVSTPNAPAALAYLRQRVDDSRLIEQLGAAFLSSQCGTISLVTTSTPPLNRFDSGFSGESGPCTDWLIQEAISHLQSAPNAVILFEDPISSASDPYDVSLASDPFLAGREHPPYWRYMDRLFWPALPGHADYRTVAQQKAWAAGFRQMIHFTKVPPHLESAFEIRLLSQEELAVVASSLQIIVTDVFDGDGYMQWRRRVPSD